MVVIDDTYAVALIPSSSTTQASSHMPRRNFLFTIGLNDNLNVSNTNHLYHNINITDVRELKLFNNFSDMSISSGGYYMGYHWTYIKPQLNQTNMIYNSTESIIYLFGNFGSEQSLNQPYNGNFVSSNIIPIKIIKDASGVRPAPMNLY